MFLFKTALRPVAVLLCLSACSMARSQTPVTPQPPSSPAPAAGQGGFPTNEQMRHFRDLGDVALSPDGKRAVARITDSTAEGGKSHLWLLDMAGGAPRQLTYSPASDKRGERGPQWMPDGASVLFLAKRGETTQLFRLPMDGGEAHAFDLKLVPPVDASKRPGALPPPTPDAAKEDPAKPVAVDVSSYRVSPDGAHIAMVIHDPDTPGEKKQKDEKADASWVDHDMHRDRLYLLTVAGEKLVPVPLDGDTEGVSWSLDGQKLVAVVEAPNGAAELGPANSAWEVSLSDPGHPRKLDALPATVGPVAYSRNGSEMYFLAQAKQDAPPGVVDLYGYTVATRAVRNLSDGLAGTLGSTEPLPLADGSVLATAEQGVEGDVLRFGKGEAGPKVVPLPFAAVRALTTNQAQSGWLVSGSRGGQAPGVVFLGKLDGQPQAVQLPEMRPAGLRSVTPKRVTWKSDKLTIDGLLYMPPQVGTAKVPLVVEVHGGPTGAFADSFCSFCDFLVGHGWAVLRPNPRGSTGRGTAFAAANKNDLGGGDLRDILAGVDFVLKTEPLDADHMALIGYSYGGEMAGFAEVKTTRFKAIVSMAPVIDQHSEYGTERGSWYDQWFYGKPWEHPEDAWRQSPLSGAGRAKTPFLLIQGESDTTDPLGQAQEMYRALRQMRVPVDLVTYPRVDHGPLAQGLYGGASPEPWHGYDVRQRIVEFLQKGFGESTSGH